MKSVKSTTTPVTNGWLALLAENGIVVEGGKIINKVGVLSNASIDYEGCDYDYGVSAELNY